MSLVFVSVIIVLHFGYLVVDARHSMDGRLILRGSHAY